MRILIALDIDDADLTRAHDGSTDAAAIANDLTLALRARLGEVYCGPHDYPVAARVAAVANVTTSLPVVLDALQVGIEGLDDDEAREAVRVTEQQVNEAHDVLTALAEAV